MKTLRWIAPPFLAVIDGIIFVINLVLSYEPKIGYGAFYLFGIWLLLLPVLPALYSATLLKDCKHRICYTLYCSCYFGFGLDALSLLMGNKIRIEWLWISVGLFVWCELGGLLGLLRYRKAKE